ncbi:MAG: acyl-CoA thioesterase [Ottowia sp.]|jgi:acyl-CoA thioester hydrolase|nr:acyl-CoA thioesterase [Ottowia sp.]
MLNLTTTVEIEIPFHDVDAMEVAWHGHYLKYFELARCALLRKFNYDYPQMQASGYLWPIVECHLRYVRPAIYGQTIRVQASLLEYENRLKIGYEIRDAINNQRLTKGYTIMVAVHAATRTLQLTSPTIVTNNLEQVCAY